VNRGDGRRRRRRRPIGRKRLLLHTRGAGSRRHHRLSMREERDRARQGYHEGGDRSSRCCRRGRGRTHQAAPQRVRPQLRRAHRTLGHGVVEQRCHGRDLTRPRSARGATEEVPLEPRVLELIELPVQAARGQSTPLAAAIHVHHHNVIDDACRRRLASAESEAAGSVAVGVRADLDLGFGQPVVHDPLAGDLFDAEVDPLRG
jgi:hypothetical protein